MADGDLDAVYRRGLVRRSALTDHFDLAVSPAIMWLVSTVVLGGDSVAPPDQVRDVHRDMLLSLLRPAWS